MSITVSGPRPGRVQIAVSDTGAGVPSEQQAAIFERFKQVDGSIKREIGGSGLGLAICKDLVTLMGGRLTLESELGVGSVFLVDIPTQGANRRFKGGGE